MPCKLLNADRLKGVHPDLVKVVERACKIADFGFDLTVIQGVRTVAQQKVNVKKGASQTMRSRHIPSSNKCKLACAVDLAPSIKGQVKWDWPLYYKFAPIVKRAAKELGTPVEWGGDWKSLKDGPHFQLPWAKYP